MSFDTLGDLNWLAVIVATIAMGMLAEATGSETVGDGIVLGLVTGVGFAATIALITATFETTKPNALVWGAINGGYHLVGLLVAAVIVSAW